MTGMGLAVSLATGNWCSMPMVQITMLQGALRAEAQDRKNASRCAGRRSRSAREGIIVAFHEVSKESYASGGELMIDKAK